MKAIVHLLYEDSKENNNLIQNLELFDYTHHHFIVTDIKNLNRNIYTSINQIFYFPQKNDSFVSLKNVVRFLKEIGYTSAKICNSKLTYNNNLENIDMLLYNLSVVDNIVYN